MSEELQFEGDIKLKSSAFKTHGQFSFGLRVWPGSRSGSWDAVIWCPAEVSLLLFQNFPHFGWRHHELA